MICSVSHATQDRVDTQTLSSVPISDRVYPCAIDDASHVYDGDTISRVRILILKPTLLIVSQLGEVFPNVVVADDGVRLYRKRCPYRWHRYTRTSAPRKSTLTARLALKKAEPTEKNAAIVARDARAGFTIRQRLSL